jgi:hypothetical protein
MSVDDGYGRGGGPMSAIDRDSAPDAEDVWDAALARYRAALDAQRCFVQAVLDERLPADVYELPAAWAAPDHLPAMPASVRAEAVALHQHTNELITMATELLARPQAAAPQPNRPRVDAGHRASSWDQRL